MELIDLGRFVLSFGLVLGLILIIAWITKRTGLHKKFQGGAQGTRLAVVESLVLDPRTRLMLIRRDRTEHLIMMSGGQPIVIETGIENDAKK